jgi:hypothetical protein
MEATLIVVKGKANKSRVFVKLPSVIGRGRDADLRVAHPMVSRRHCELYDENGLMKIRDLGSLNGIVVGDQRVDRAILPPNAMFSVGPLTFRAEYEYVGAEVPSTGKAAARAEFDFQQHLTVEPAEAERPRADLAAEALSDSDEMGIAPADGALPDFSALVGQDVDSEGSDAGRASTPADTLPGVPGDSVDQGEQAITELPPTDPLLEIPAAGVAEQTEPEPTPPPTVPGGDRKAPGSKGPAKGPQNDRDQAQSDAEPGAGPDEGETGTDAAGTAEQEPDGGIDDDQLQKLLDELG